jgi:DNA-binding response OmpR family regulator
MPRVRILIADPDPQIRAWLKPPLVSVASEVLEATTGPELESLLRAQGPFHLVVTNARLPTQSGVEILARARSNGNRTPFIVVTSVQERLLRVYVSDAEGTVLSSRVLDADNLGVLVSTLLKRADR